MQGKGGTPPEVYQAGVMANRDQGTARLSLPVREGLSQLLREGEVDSADLPDVDPGVGVL